MNCNNVLNFLIKSYSSPSKACKTSANLNESTRASNKCELGLKSIRLASFYINLSRRTSKHKNGQNNVYFVREICKTISFWHSVQKIKPNQETTRSYFHSAFFIFSIVSFNLPHAFDFMWQFCLFVAICNYH